MKRGDRVYFKDTDGIAKIGILNEFGIHKEIKLWTIDVGDLAYLAIRSERHLILLKEDGISKTIFT